MLRKISLKNTYQRDGSNIVNKIRKDFWQTNRQACMLTDRQTNKMDILVLSRFKSTFDWLIDRHRHSGRQTDRHVDRQMSRVVSRFLNTRFHPTRRQLFPFYFSNITLRTNLLIFEVTGPVFKIAIEMRRLLAYFDNPGWDGYNSAFDRLIERYRQVKKHKQANEPMEEGINKWTDWLKQSG